jgi:ABC-type bacteriocin/lantibiotic exporter with double-glycine peptidase domain
MKLAIFLLNCVLGAASTIAPLNVPFLRQQKNGCGAASVAMVARYWVPKTAPPHESIYRALIDADRKGVPLAGMKGYFQEIGFRAFTLRGQWADIEHHLAKGRPLIVTLQDTRTRRLHFAVLIGLEDRHVWLNDPTRKRAERTDRRKFEEQWTAAGNWLLLAAPAAQPVTR